MLLEDTISLYFIYDVKYIIEIIKNLKYKHFESFNETVLKNEFLIISLLNDKKIDKKSMAYEFKFVSEDIRSNLNFMKNYIYENPYLYSYCFGDIKRDYELTKFVLSKDGIVLGNCYQSIKEDKEINTIIKNKL